MVRDNNQWWTLANTVMNQTIPPKAKNFYQSCFLTKILYPALASSIHATSLTSSLNDSIIFFQIMALVSRERDPPAN